MGYEPRLITPFKNGLVTYYKPWLIGEDAFPSISNAYAWRGSVRKREGYSLIASLPNADAPVQGLKNWINPRSLTATLIAYSLDKSYIYDIVPDPPEFKDITFLANPAGTAFTWSNQDTEYYWTSNYASSMWSTNNLTADSIRFWNGTNGALGVNGGWSIHKPTVSGLTRLEAALIVLPYKGRLVVLNTTEAGNNFQSRARWSQIGTPYTSNSTRINISGITAGSPTVINISNTSSFIIGKPAGITDVVGSIGTVLNFNQFNVSAIVPNTSITIDVDTTGLAYTTGGFVQGPGTTEPPAPFEISIFGWRSDIVGRGGYVDADTSERIVSADIVKDTLIVFFQRSTWRLRYTGNEILPFIWERLNTQYGAESQYSNVPFDESILAFSRFGWIASDTNNVARIDENIPDSSFSVNSGETLGQLNRVQGIRDYYRQMSYWTFPSLDPGNEPDQIYVYNYIDKNWSIFEPSSTIRCFGQFSQTLDMTWQNLSDPTDTWANYNGAQDRWRLFGSSQNAQFPIIAGGDINGNVYEMFQFGVNPITTDNEVNFNFEIWTKRFNPYISKGLKCRIGYVDLYMTTITGCEVTFNHFVNDQGNPVLSRTVEVYPRGVVPITLIAVGSTTTFTCESSHNLIAGQQVLLTDINGLLGGVFNNQEWIVSAILNETRFQIAMNTQGMTYEGGGLLNATIRNNYGDATYTRVYLGAIAHTHQFQITLSGSQLSDPIKGDGQFELQGMVIWSRACGMIRG